MMDKIREGFDSWWRNANPRLTDLPKEQAYYIWKASRAALVVGLPELEAGDFIEDTGMARGYEDGQEFIIELVKSSLNQSGIKYE